MPYKIDSLICDRVEIEQGKWVVARPYIDTSWWSIKRRFFDAWAVLTAKADAVTFYKQ